MTGHWGKEIASLPLLNRAWTIGSVCVNITITGINCHEALATCPTLL